MSLLTRRGCCCFTHDRKEYFLRLENVRKSLLATERRIKKKEKKKRKYTLVPEAVGNVEILCLSSAS